MKILVSFVLVHNTHIIEYFLILDGCLGLIIP